MNKIINKVLLAEEKFMPKLHLRQPGLTNSECGPFTKHRDRILKSRETGNLKHIYKYELDKACFTHDAAYSDSKDLAKELWIRKVEKRGLASMVYNIFEKKCRSGNECKSRTS